MKLANNLDFSKLQSLNRVAQNLASAPATPVAGQEYYDTATNMLYIYNGVSWAGTDPKKVTGIPLANLATDPLARANHTGTQTASTISDFNTAVRTNSLNQLATATGNYAMGGFTLTGLPSPTASGQAAEYSWVIAQIQASAAGIDNKPSVIAVATTNLASLSGTAQTVDGVALNTVGMRVLLTGQSTASQNGPWVVQAGAWIRPTGETVTTAAFWLVEQGTTNQGTQWKVSTTGTITLDTTPLTIAQFGAGAAYSAGNGLTGTTTFSILLRSSSGLVLDGTGVGVDTSVVVRKFAATIGDGSATTIQVTHGLNTQDVTVSVREVSTNTAVLVDWVANGVNTVQFVFAVAPASNSYRVVIHA